MKSGDILRNANITRDTLRHYVDIGLVKPEINPTNGYKVYSGNDLELIKFVKQAQGIGFSLSSIKKLAEQMNSSTCKHHTLLPYLEKQLKEVTAKIESLENIKSHLTRLINDFEEKNCEEHPEGLEL